MPGNPFGNKTGPWPPDQVLRFYFNAGLTFDEVADAVFRYNKEAWRPARSAVSRKYQLMGMPPRRSSHSDLLPWKIRPEHNNDELRHMLQAEGRARILKEGETLSVPDRSLTERLHNLLFGRGQPMVVTYHPEVGFGLVIRQDYDDDIVRMPRVDQYADAGVNEGRSKRKSRTKATASTESGASIDVA